MIGFCDSHSSAADETNADQVISYLLGTVSRWLAIKRGGGILFWKPPWNFSFFTFSLDGAWKFQTKTAPPLEIPQIFVRFLGNSKTKDQDHDQEKIFLGHPLRAS